MYIRCSWYVFNEPLPSNDCLSWFCCCGFQASCHIAPSLRLLVPSRLLTYAISSSSPRGRACDIYDRPRECHRNVILVSTNLPVSKTSSWVYWYQWDKFRAQFQLWGVCQAVRTSADSVKDRYQETSSEDREDFMCAIITVIF
jgi:hypothetical protein